jgi:hypothetical protein
VPTLFSKGVRDSVLDRYAGGAFPFPAMRSGTVENQWTSQEASQAQRAAGHSPKECDCIAQAGSLSLSIVHDV